MTRQVTKVISGGQSGVDAAGIFAAHDLGIETGGTMPPGYQTEHGPNYYMRDYYGLREISKELQRGLTGKAFYIPRTEENVKNSDGTVYYTTTPDENVGGLKQTRDATVKFEKPFILNPSAPKLRQWLINNNIKTLNVAGNRETKLTSQQIANIRKLLTEALSCPILDGTQSI